ncbi:MAG TPA: PAS domain-containing protein [Candidatus Saccharimonadales bacterium]|nr:PAS domain-containing protein [Candidatus Saccharimonadales bacterium]
MSLTIEPDFLSIFEALPGCYVILTPKFDMVAATKAYYEATLTTPKVLLGNNVFDIFPEDAEHLAPGEGKDLTFSLNLVLRTKKPHTIPLQRYDLDVRAHGEHKLLERWWRQTNIPVLNDKGELIYIINAVEDVTDMLRTLENAQESIKRLHSK